MKKNKLIKQNSNYREAKKLEREMKRLAKDIDNIVSQHNSFTKDHTSISAQNWIESLPVESLKDSVNIENGKPTKKLTLGDLVQKSQLAKQFEEKTDKLDILAHKHNEAKIGAVLDKIEKLLKKLDRKKKV